MSSIVIVDVVVCVAVEKGKRLAFGTWKDVLGGEMRFCFDGESVELETSQRPGISFADLATAAG